MINSILESVMNQPFPKDLENNWRTGAHQESVHYVGGDYHDFVMNDNYVACVQPRMNDVKLSYFLKIFYRRTMAVARVVTSKFLLLNKIVMMFFCFLGNSARLYQYIQNLWKYCHVFASRTV